MDVFAGLAAHDRVVHASGAVDNWDNHNSIAKQLPQMCAETDQPVAALLIDLKQRGLLDDTLVLWNTEFGRMPL